MSNICIKVEDLSKRFLVLKTEKTFLRTLNNLLRRESFKKEMWILHNISFEIKKGEKLAIIGKNGCGKTTLLRILMGIYGKTSGYLEVNVEPKALFKFWIGLNGELSVIDNIYLFGTVYGMDRHFLNQNMDKILDLAGLYDLRFSSLKELSNGQTQRLALSVFFQSKSNFLIFDESLVFVDQVFANKCETYFEELAASDKTVIMTSHNSSFLRKYCHTAIWLDEGYIRMSGEANDVIDKYEEQMGS